MVAMPPELVLRARVVREVAELVEKAVKPIFETVATADAVYTFKHRIKSLGAILSKVSRKREEGDGEDSAEKKVYSPEHLTDAWGTRFVTLYQSHIPLILDRLLSDIEKHNNAHGRTAIRFLEFVIYTNRPDGDPLSIVKETQQVATRHSRPELRIRIPENRKSAYSSVHLILSHDVTIDTGGAVEVATGKFEVQIRDIFEEGWGEIQHHLLYSAKDKATGAAFDPRMTQHWMPHLNALKTFVDGCSQHASIIKRSYDISREQPAMPSLDNTSATSQPDDLRAILHVLSDKADTRVVDDIKVAYSLIELASSTSEFQPTDNYLEAAEKLRSAISKLGDLLLLPVASRGDRPVGYFLRIELGNALVASMEEEHVAEAKEIFQQVAIEVPNDPIVMLRLSGAIAKTAAKDKEAIREIVRLTKTAVRLAAADPLTGRNHWLTIAALIREGFAWYCMSEIELQSNFKLDQLRSAAEVTIGAYEYWRDLPEAFRTKDSYKLYAHKALSNVLFYLAAVAKNDPFGTEAKEQIAKYLEHFEKLEVPVYREYYKTRDNLIRALQAIGDPESRAKAQMLARQNYAELWRLAEMRAGRSALSITEVKAILDDTEWKNFVVARRILREDDLLDDVP